ncbi:hypothetical protein AAFF_G00093820 [Aldrovandia affinis]|uniref:Uncharacterized protein n=1 Tax=Aldrovandia affinis TaxID=143900 RepID=A0AAD7T2Y1_9TELE|nr:hypothetical protein AAFF_G00093820 [Aldrovandia affinis]
MPGNGVYAAPIPNAARDVASIFTLPQGPITERACRAQAQGPQSHPECVLPPCPSSRRVIPGRLHSICNIQV